MYACTYVHICVYIYYYSIIYICVHICNHQYFFAKPQNYCSLIFPFQCLSIALWWFLNLKVSSYSGIWKQLSVTGTGVPEAIYTKLILDSVLISSHFTMTLMGFLTLFFTCPGLHLYRPSITKQ